MGAQTSPTVSFQAAAAALQQALIYVTAPATVQHQGALSQSTRVPNYN